MAGVRTTSAIASLARSSSAVAGPSRLPAVALPRPRSLNAHPALRPICTTASVRSGHNKWSKIKHKKGAADQQRSLKVGRLCKDIYSALRPPNSPDPAINARLATALARAKEGGVTKANIETAFAKCEMRAVAEGSGKEMIYEGIGPGGREAVIIQCVSDNPNRTIQGINKAMDRYKFRIAPVSYLFEKRGLITIDPSQSSKSFDELFEVALEGGASDVVETEGEEGPEWEVYTETNQLGSLTSLLSTPPHSTDFSLVSSEMAYVPNDPLEVAEEEGGEGITEQKAESILSMVEALEEDADVVKVWTNLA